MNNWPINNQMTGLTRPPYPLSQWRLSIKIHPLTQSPLLLQKAQSSWTACPKTTCQSSMKRWKQVKTEIFACPLLRVIYWAPQPCYDVLTSQHFSLIRVIDPLKNVYPPLSIFSPLFPSSSTCPSTKYFLAHPEYLALPNKFLLLSSIRLRFHICHFSLPEQVMESALMLSRLLLLPYPVLLPLVIIMLSLAMFMLMAMPASAVAQVQWAMLGHLGPRSAASPVLPQRVEEMAPSPTITL